MQASAGPHGPGPQNAGAGASAVSCAGRGARRSGRHRRRSTGWQAIGGAGRRRQWQNFRGSTSRAFIRLPISWPPLSCRRAPRRTFLVYAGCSISSSANKPRVATSRRPLCASRISPKSTAAFPLRPTRIGWRRWSRRVPRIRLRPRRADGRRIEPSVSAQRRRWRWLDCSPRNARSGGHRKTHRRSGWPQKFQKDTATYRTFFVFVG